MRIKRAISIVKSVVLCLSVGYTISSCSSSANQRATQEESLMALSEKEILQIKKEINADKKAAFIEQIIQQKVAGGFNGNVLVAQKGVIIYQKAFGFADFKDTIRLTNDSKFQLASLSKTFTAVAVMQLVEKGKLGLTNEVKDFYPNFPYPGVTIHSLLCHRSGLPYYEYLMNDETRQKEWYPSNQEMMAWFAAQNPTPQAYNLPDHFFSYNNTNFAILAAIVEKVSGLSFDAYMQKNILQPLGMNNTFVATSTSPALNVNRTVGYQRNLEIPKDYYDNITGDKGIYSTTGDLFRWYVSLRDAKLLSKESLREVFTPRSFEHPGIRNYGYGFRLWLDAQQRTDYVYHTGWWKGYNTIMFCDLREDFVVILLTNRLNKTVYHIKEIIDALNDGKKAQSVEDNILDS